MRDVVTLILGGGRGTRLFPLTALRSKPAVPIGGKYRLIDVPISLCLHADLRRIFILTQFNSASLNRHVAQTYRLDNFTDGFVEILAAEQTPDRMDWFQGTADAVRQALRHFIGYDASHYLVLAGDHLYRMDLRELLDVHVETRADVTIAAQPVTRAEAPGMGIFRFDLEGQIVAFEEKPSDERLAAIGTSIPSGSTLARPGPEVPFIASMGIYVFSHDVLLDLLARHAGALDFGKEIIPSALEYCRVRAHFHRGYWADVGTIRSFYDANVALTRTDAPFSFYHPHRPIYTHPRFLPGSRLFDCTIHDSVIAEGCWLEACHVSETVVGIRTRIGAGSRITRSVLLGADFHEGDEQAPAHDGQPPLGIGRDVVLDRVIVDKNARIGAGARLTNAKGINEADGEGYYIREGIIVVPKGAVVKEGAIV